VHLGCAGWSIPRAAAERFPAEGSHLERYAAVFDAVEIDSSFYRPHRRAVYERWAASVPDDFRFAVKVPRAVSHDQSLVAADVLLEVFLDDARGLGARLGPLLVQLPPSLAYHADDAATFFGVLRVLHDGPVACEPRHPTWFEPPADALLRRDRIARVAADPACVPAAAVPGGDLALVYYRLHGSPHMYRSDYEPARLDATSRALARHERTGADVWCIFDNTTLGAATGNALALAERLRDAPTPTPRLADVP
jgi:uncharacterized protein YecE (DUF72 family)